MNIRETSRKKKVDHVKNGPVDMDLDVAEQGRSEENHTHGEEE